jgi:hypothetical protein
MPEDQRSSRSAALLGRLLFKKAAILLVVGVAFGWFYGWAAPWAFPAEPRAGFGRGVLHGALMPIALPSLLLGHDVEIYDANNSGRTYKLGYIVGINLCGLVFFGSAFWRPQRSAKAPAGEDHNHHLR